MNHRETFHLYLLAGQSNMAGRGLVEPDDQQPHPRVRTLNRECVWVPAADPIHFDKPIAGVGPGLTFGKIMAETDPAVQIGLIPCAVGGSAITHWEPGAWYEPVGCHPYEDAVRRARVALRDGVLRAILWHQGETDAMSREEATRYEERLTTLIARLRADLACPNVPFLAGTLGDFLGSEYPGAEAVNAALRRVAARLSRVIVVESKGLVAGSDALHFDAPSARELGRRFAEARKGLELT